MMYREDAQYLCFVLTNLKPILEGNDPEPATGRCRWRPYEATGHFGVLGDVNAVI